MGTPYLTAILVCTAFAVVAELISLLFPRKMLSLLTMDPRQGVSGPLLKVLGWLSMFYMLDLGLLLFSGDPIFQSYAGLMLAMAVVLWVLRKRLVSMPVVLMLESTLCLAMLIDVGRTVLPMLGLVAVQPPG